VPRSTRQLALLLAVLPVFGTMRAGFAQVPADAVPTTMPSITFPSGTIDPESVAEQVVESLSIQLVDKTLDANRREDVALRLASIDSASARAALLRSLTDPGDSVGRLAVAHALADSKPADQFIDPLFVLLDDGNSRPLLDAAAAALSYYKSSSAVVTRLISIGDSNKTEPVRRAAISALGTMSDKRVAQKLVGWTSDPSIVISSAASDALANLSGELFASAGEWQRWWEPISTIEDSEFREAMLVRRSARLDQTRRAADSANLELRNRLTSDFNAASRERKPSILEAALASREPAVRASAAHLVADLATTAEVPPSVRSLLPGLVSDPSVDVRLDVARAIESLNDRTAFDPIALQLVVESDARVRAALVRTLGVMREEPRSVPLLLRMLDDPSSNVIVAVTNAIGDGGDSALGSYLATKDAASARQIARRLNSIFNERFSSGETSAMRESTLRAMVALRQPELLPSYRALLTADAGEPARIRQLALQGIGNIGDPQTAPLVVDKLDDESGDVRADAVRALGRVSEDFTHAETLFRRLDPAVEPDERVRKEVWETIRQLLPLASRNQLELWPDRFENDAIKRVDVLAALVVLDDRAGNQSDLVDHLTGLGDTQLQLGRYADALVTFNRALLLAGSQGLGQFKVRLTELTLDAHLKSRDYRAAVDFAAKTLQSEGDAYQIIVGPKLKLEAQKLADASQLAEAKMLIEQALAMSPQLGLQYRGDLTDLRNSVNSRLNERNQADSDPSMRAELSDAFSTIRDFVELSNHA